MSPLLIVLACIAIALALIAFGDPVTRQALKRARKSKREPIRHWGKRRLP